jgi:ABC-type multidrug transport system fused ATPase/permease subunit
MRKEELMNVPFIQKLESLKNDIISISGEQYPENIKKEIAEFKDYTINLIDYIKNRILEYSDLILINYRTIQFLETNNNYIQQCINTINQFKINQINILQMRDQVAGFLETILSNVNHRFPLNLAAFGNTTQIQNEVDNFLRKIDEAIDKIKNKETELESFSQKLKTIEDNYNTLNDNIQQTITLFNNDYNNLKSNVNDDFKSEKEKLIQQSSTIIKELNTKLEEAKNLVNAIGNEGVSHSYKEAAEHHKKQANLFRWISLSIMILAAIYLAIVIFGLTSQSFDWKISIIRVLSVSLFIYPAQYAANQSNKHRELENYNRKMELDLAAINPFIELLDEPKKKEIKEKLVERYFKPLEIEKNKDEVPLTTYERIVNTISELIKKLK